MDLLSRGVMEAGWGIYSMSAKVSAAEEMYEAALKSGIPERRIKYWGPGSGECFNWADYEYHGYGTRKGSVDGLMSAFKSAVEVMMRSAGQKASEPFWEFMNDQAFANLFFIDGQANGGISLSRILEILQTLPRTDQDLDEPHRFPSLIALKAAQRNCPPEQRRALKLAEDWMQTQMVGLSERTRSCVEAMAIGMLDGQCRDTMQEAMGGASTWTPEEIGEHGWVVICAYDVKRFGVIGKLINVLGKVAVYKKAERRLQQYRGNMSACRPIAVIADEAQFFMDSVSDLDFLRTSRESRAACFWSIQSIPSVVAELGGGDVARNMVDALGSMFQTKIFNQNDCDVTNKKCAAWIGEETAKSYGQSIGVNGRGESNVSLNWNERMEPLVATTAFQRLPRGGREFKWEVRAFVMMAGHAWKCNEGRYWAKIKFFQNCEPEKPLKWWQWFRPQVPVSIHFDKVPTARKWSRHIPWRTLALELWSEKDPQKRKRILERWCWFWRGKDEEFCKEARNAR